MGAVYYDFARGIDHRAVEPVRVRKSVGCESTFEKDLVTHTGLIVALWHIADELIRRLQKADFHGHTLTLKVKFADFTQRTRSISVGHELRTMQEILPLAKRLLNDMQLQYYRVRLMGLAVSNPLAEQGRTEPVQLSLGF